MIQDKKINVLFVCMGNICRSPTADAVFKQYIQVADLEDLVYVDSAGTHAYHINEPPDRRSQNAARKRGYSMHELRARSVENKDFAKFHYILAMDKNNLEILKDRCPPQYHYKLDLFMKYSKKWNALQEIDDPYYGGSYGFERVLDLVEESSEGLLNHLLNHDLKN